MALMQSPLLTNRKGQKAKQIIVLVFKASNDLVAVSVKVEVMMPLTLHPLSAMKKPQYLMPSIHRKSQTNFACVY